MKNQAEMIKSMSHQELTKQLIFSQLFLLIMALLTSMFLFDPFVGTWISLFHADVKSIFIYGVIPALFILSIDLLLLNLLPKHMYDDGGINEKIFRERPIVQIIAIAALIAVCEELLFRGVIHTEAGLVVASLIFALIHIRYLRKLILLISVLLVSFFLGYMYELTQNLWVTIVAHFLVDAILGIWIRLGYWGNKV